MWIGGQSRARALTRMSGARCPAANAGSISIASRGSFRKRRANWPCWKRWMAASRSRNRATSICRWSPRISSITPAGRTNWSTHSPAGRRAARRCGQIIPWNFPLLMAAWKLAPALACGNTVRAQARGDDEHHRAASGADFSGSGTARRRGEHRHRRGRDRARAGRASRRRQDRVHRLDRSRQDADREGRRGHAARSSRSNSAARRRNIIFEDAPIDQAVEGIIAGIYFNQGHVCCAGSRLLVQEGVFPTVIRKLRDRIATLRVGNPLDKNTDIGAINSRSQLEKIRELVESGLQRRRRAGAAALPLAGERLLVSAELLHRRDRVASHGAGGNFRTGAERDDIPHAGGSDRAREQHALRIERRRVDGQGQQDFQDGRTSCAPAWSGRTPTTSSIRPARSAATRKAASAAKAVCTDCCRIWS